MCLNRRIYSPLCVTGIDDVSVNTTTLTWISVCILIIEVMKKAYCYF